MRGRFGFGELVEEDTLAAALSATDTDAPDDWIAGDVYLVGNTEIVFVTDTGLRRGRGGTEAVEHDAGVSVSRIMPPVAVTYAVDGLADTMRQRRDLGQPAMPADDLVEAFADDLAPYMRVYPRYPYAAAQGAATGAAAGSSGGGGGGVFPLTKWPTLVAHSLTFMFSDGATHTITLPGAQAGEATSDDIVEAAILEGTITLYRRNGRTLELEVPRPLHDPAAGRHAQHLRRGGAGAGGGAWPRKHGVGRCGRPHGGAGQRARPRLRPAVHHG